MLKSNYKDEIKDGKKCDLVVSPCALSYSVTVY